MNKVAIHWFRQDLRLSDNPSLFSATKSSKVLPIYILDDINSSDYKMGSASRWWLHNSLKSLNDSLGNNLSLYIGDPEIILKKLIAQYDVTDIFWNRCYEPWRLNRDKDIKVFLENRGVRVKTFNGSLLWEPWEVLKKDGTPYKVFTPFYKNGCLGTSSPRVPMTQPKLKSFFSDEKNRVSLDDLGLIPEIKWYRGLEEIWEPGETGAKKKLLFFIENGLLGYKEGRNFPSKKKVSQLSAHLHFGEISPNQVWYETLSQDFISGISDDLFNFHSELGWREFSYNLLFYFPDLPKENFQKKFNNFPWEDNQDLLDKWKKGLTGFPIVDAGMRELWKTGYMHNRVRMIVGSFLVKNLLLHWKEGEKWFWDCLIDADLASNSASWQWIAGSGADATPYFRIFNPIIQGLKFDPEGKYTKKYLPELSRLPNKFLYNPWEAPQDILDSANIILGKDYPKPIVNLKESRDKALKAFETIRVI